MRNLKAQTRNGDCGLYNLANVLQDEDIILYGQDYEAPFGITEQNQILAKSGWDNLRVQPLIGSYNYKIEVPIDFLITVCTDIVQQVKIKVEDDIETTPFILGVQANSNVGEEGLHAVTLFHHKSNWYLSDPRWVDWILLTNIHQLLQYYEYINSAYLLVNEEEKQICIKSKHYDQEEKED